MVAHFSQNLLQWYHRYARILPWRLSSQDKDARQGLPPYFTWLSEIMLQQTTVTAVKPYFERFTSKWKKVEDLASASRDEVFKEWAGLGYYSRAKNLHACAVKIVQDYAGEFPDSEDELRKLPGIGAYTAAAITSIAFGKRAVVVDGNVERIISRVFALDVPAKLNKDKIYEKADYLTPKNDCGDYAQAMMDLGATICTPKSPKCLICPVNDFCMAFKVGQSEIYPIKLPKVKKPERFGKVFWIETACGKVLLEKRPDKGLLASMIGFPTTAWESDMSMIKDYPDIIIGVAGQTKNTQHTIKHVFTHFTLYLDLCIISCDNPQPIDNPDYFWVNKTKLSDYALPSLMQKVGNIIQKEEHYYAV